MNGFVDIYTIIFLVIAVVIFLRLRSVLGRRTGNERPPFDPYSKRESLPGAANGKVIDMPRRGAAAIAGSGETVRSAADRIKTAAAEGTPLNDSLTAVAAADATFDAREFLEGARKAYEMIVTAFAEGERKTLRQLLSREVYDGFLAAITQREGRGEAIEFKFVGIDKSEIVAAGLKDGAAQVTVRFLSKLVSATRDKDEKLIEGDPTRVGTVTDIWTFAREVASRDPNWKLVATESVE